MWSGFVNKLFVLFAKINLMFLKSKSTLAIFHPCLQQQAVNYAKKASAKKGRIGKLRYTPLVPEESIKKALGGAGQPRAFVLKFGWWSNLLFQCSTFAIPQNALERCRGRAELYFRELPGGFLQLGVVFK
jgi:hypothetical protein